MLLSYICNCFSINTLSLLWILFLFLFFNYYSSEITSCYSSLVISLLDLFLIAFVFLFFIYYLTDKIFIIYYIALSFLLNIFYPFYYLGFFNQLGNDFFYYWFSIFDLLCLNQNKIGANSEYVLPVPVGLSMIANLIFYYLSASNKINPIYIWIE